MVFVEGKLRSWGRAEMVVTILDTEVTLSATPLECTLEDIIEAVRNCGDRKSSLVYLKQTCEICYSDFPMSKVILFRLDLFLVLNEIVFRRLLRTGLFHDWIRECFYIFLHSPTKINSVKSKQG